MPFMEADMEQEARELQAMIEEDSELQKAAEQFDKEYELRKKLVLARKGAGLTQKELEEKAGLPYRAISRLESNTNVSPNVRTLIKYLNAMGYELDIVKTEHKYTER